MAKYCPNCGAKNEDSYKFCVNCGYNIADLKPTQQPETQSMPKPEETYHSSPPQKEPESEYPYIPKSDKQESKNKGINSNQPKSYSYIKPPEQSEQSQVNYQIPQQTNQSSYQSTQQQTYRENHTGYQTQSGYQGRIDYSNLSPQLQERIKLWEAYIQKNTEYYIPKFIEFYTMDKKASWNWAAFFFPLYWMAYRKMMDKAVFTLIPFMIPFVNFLIFFVVGIIGNYLYYTHVENMVKIALEREKTQNINAIEYLQRNGGTDTKGIFIMMLLIIGVGMFVQILMVAISGGLR